MLETTFRLLRDKHACRDRYYFLRKTLGKGYCLDTPIGLDRILKICGLEDALWALRAVMAEKCVDRNKIVRIFVCRCARETPLLDGRTTWEVLDKDSRMEIEAVERAELEGKVEKDWPWPGNWTTANVANWASVNAKDWAVRMQDFAWKMTGEDNWALARKKAMAAQKKILRELLSGDASLTCLVTKIVT